MRMPVLDMVTLALDGSLASAFGMGPLFVSVGEIVLLELHADAIMRRSRCT